MTTAAIIIIGNEILSGRTQDTNSSYLCAGLRALGVEVVRISVIPDDVDTIAEEVAALSRSCDLVFTSGGIGPTHDDMTMEGVAKAFGCRTVTDPSIIEMMRMRCGDELSETSLKMAQMPEGAEMIGVPGMDFPPLLMRNVYVFPGVPELLRRKFEAIKDRFRSRPFLIRKVFVRAEECVIADHLTRIDAAYPEVSVGSYPRIDTPEYKVVVTLESRDPALLARAFDEVLGLLPPSSIVRTE